jgi:hypothetical protein
MHLSASPTASSCETNTQWPQLKSGLAGVPDEQLVPAVLNGGVGVLEDSEVVRLTGREVEHCATLPNSLGEI